MPNKQKIGLLIIAAVGCMILGISSDATIPLYFLFLLFSGTVIYMFLQNLPFWCLGAFIGLAFVLGNLSGLFARNEATLTLGGWDYSFEWLLDNINGIAKESEFIELTLLGLVLRFILFILYGLFVDIALHLRVLIVKFDLYVNDTKFRSKAPFKVTAKIYYSLKMALRKHKVTLAFDFQSRKVQIQTTDIELIDFDIASDGAVTLYTFEEM